MTGQPTRILLIEDNPEHARLLREMLTGMQQASFNLTHAEQLKEGLAKVSDETFDVLLLDLSLPDSQGLDTFDRAYEVASDVPIVVLTGVDDAEIAVQAVQRGAQDFLVKGQVKGDLLGRALRYAIKRHQLGKKMQELQEQILEAERSRVLAQTAVAAAHEISQPLTAVIGNTELLLHATFPEDSRKRMLEEILKAGRRIDEIVKKMKTARQVVTKPYLNKVTMVDFDAASQEEQEDEQQAD